MRRFSNKFIVVISVFVMVIALIGCQPQTKILNTDDILTQKKTEKGRIPITISVKYAFTINNFEKVVEERFPNIDLIQVGNYTASLGIEEQLARLKNDDLTDIVMTWPYDVGEEYWKDRLIDLSGMSFSSHYNTSVLDMIERDGKLFYLPGPSQIRGIVYNKTLFREKGWEVPSDYNGFIKLCQTIEKTGIRALQLGFKNPEVLDTAFIGYNYGDAYSKPYNRKWLENFNQGEGDFKDNFSDALDNFQEMISEGVFKESDLEVDYSERERMFFNRECAMIEDSVLMSRMGEDYNGCQDEFALMPFFNKGSEASWSRLYMVCFFGLNKHLEEDKNKTKYDLVMKLMEYISTPEGQEVLSSDTGAMYSSVDNSKAPNIHEIKDLVESLESGRAASFPELERSQEALRDGLVSLLKKTKTKDEVIQQINEQNKHPVEKSKPKVIGKAEQTFSIIKSGEYIADVIKDEAKTEIALFLDNGKDGLYNGKGVTCKFYQGDLTMEDVNRVFPDLKSPDRGVLYKAKMTGKNIKETLEHSIKVSNKDEWIYYFSGLIVEFDVFAEGGHRVKKISLSNGSLLDDNKEYSVAFMDDSVSEHLLFDKEDTKKSVKELLIESIQSSGAIAPNKENRLILK